MPKVNSGSDTSIRNKNFQMEKKLRLSETNLRKNGSICSDFLLLSQIKIKTLSL